MQSVRFSARVAHRSRRQGPSCRSECQSPSATPDGQAHQVPRREVGREFRGTAVQPLCNSARDDGGQWGEQRGAETACSSCFHSRSVPSGSLPKLEVAGSSPVVGCIREPGAAFACQLIASSEARRCRRAPPRLRRRCGRWTSSRRPGRRSAAEVVAGVCPWALPTCPRAARGRGAVRSHRAAAREN